MTGAIIGIVGVVIGILLNEMVRRVNRKELFSEIVFNKRLEAYEYLLELIDEGQSVCCEIIDNPKLTGEQKHEMVSNMILPICEWGDKKRLYLDEEIAVHCMTLFMGIEDVDFSNKESKEDYLKKYNTNLIKARKMIYEDSGVAKTNKLFKSINKPKIDSDVIDYLRTIKKEHSKNID